MVCEYSLWYNTAENSDMIPQLVTKTQQITEEILGRMGIPAEVMVEVGEDEVLKVNISALPDNDEGLGILIGYRGSTLRSLQLVLGLIINKGREDWTPVVVDVGDYKKNHEETLRSLARRTMEKARFLKEPVSLSPMNAYDRRIIHLEVAEVEDMISESVGEEPRRRVVVRPKE